MQYHCGPDTPTEKAPTHLIDKLSLYIVIPTERSPAYSSVVKLIMVHTDTCSKNAFVGCFVFAKLIILLMHPAVIVCLHWQD
jgi:hypothetical protein